MNIIKDILIEPNQSIDNLMHKIRDIYLIDCDNFNKMVGKKFLSSLFLITEL